MDAPQGKENKVNANSQCPVVVIRDIGEVHIQLEGSHTTSTETESLLDTNKKNVKFKNENEVGKQHSKEMLANKLKDDRESSGKPTEFSDKEVNLSEVKITKVVCDERKEKNHTETQENATGQSGVNQNENVATVKKSEQVRLQPQKNQISNKSKEISERFENIIDMFDSFAKDVEALDVRKKSDTFKQTTTGGSKRKRAKSERMKDQQEVEEPQRHRSRSEDYSTEYPPSADCHDAQVVRKHEVLNFIPAKSSCTELFGKIITWEHPMPEAMPLKEFKKAQEIKNTKTSSISTATSSCEIKSLGCQTQLSDYISVNELSSFEGSSVTSSRLQPNSLNNYAQADNACVAIDASQQEIIKEPLIGTLIQEPLISPTGVQQPSTELPFNVITIEADSRPPSTDIRRPPFCQRLWELIGDFCAATFLCLQVNRDCIFCLGFFAAFVVSASFLTAFFYHTLIISPSLWQTEQAY